MYEITNLHIGPGVLTSAPGVPWAPGLTSLLGEQYYICETHMLGAHMPKCITGLVE